MKKSKVNPYQHTKSQIAKHSRPEIVQRTVNKAKRRANNIEIINNLNLASILCIGARHDSEVQSFIDAGYYCIGIDIATKTNLILRVDAHEIDTHSMSFDLVYASHSLEHMHDPVKVLKNIRKIARVGLLAILPVTSDLKPGHPVIFDIMANPPDIYTGDPDFKVLEPYEIAHYEKNNEEITVLFRYTGRYHEKRV